MKSVGSVDFFLVALHPRSLLRGILARIIKFDTVENFLYTAISMKYTAFNCWNLTLVLKGRHGGVFM